MSYVTVVIPAYNRADLICETVDSVLAQTYQDFEIVIVDDGSTDDTTAVLAPYLKHNVRVIYQDNQGEGSARNSGILAAKGEYIAFVDSDDLWMPTKLERQMAIFANRPQLAWVYTDAYAFDSDSKQELYILGEKNPQYEGAIAHQLLLHNFIASPTPIVRRSVFDEVGVFNHNPIAADWDMWLRIAAKYPIGRIAEVLAGYRVHSNAISQNSDPLLAHKYRIDTIERSVTNAPDVYGIMRDQSLAAYHTHTGSALAKKGELREARRMFLQAIRLSPTILPAYPRLVATLLGKRFNSYWITQNRKRLGLVENL